MALFNYTTKEITLKIVYYGPGFSGKTTNLQYLHSVLPADARGKLISMATEGDRTIFFDFLPVEVGKISEFNIRFQLYTVPGQVRYNATRRLVLKGADAIVFVADSQTSMKEQNIESLVNMRENLEANNLPLDIPKVFQYNKRDIDNIMSIEELNKDINNEGAPYFEAVAVEGKGVEKTFMKIARDALEYIKKRHDVDITIPEGSFITSGKMPKVAPEKEVAKKPAVSERPVEVVEEVKRPEPPKPPPVQPREEEVVSFPQRKEPQQAPQVITPDLSEIVGAINGLKEALSEINRSLKGIQINQSKNIEAINELQNLFAEMKKEKKKGFRLFR
jgi:signal recognition particle receptor subunit beta